MGPTSYDDAKGLLLSSWWLLSGILNSLIWFGFALKIAKYREAGKILLKNVAVKI